VAFTLGWRRVDRHAADNVLAAFFQPIVVGWDRHCRRWQQLLAEACCLRLCLAEVVEPVWASLFCDLDANPPSCVCCSRRWRSPFLVGCARVL